MEDIRIGRESSATYFNATSNGATPVSICRADVKRIALVVSADGRAVVTIGPRNSGAAPNVGIALSIESPVVKLRLEDVGSALWQEWVVFDNGATSNVFVISTELGKV